MWIETSTYDTIETTSSLETQNNNPLSDQEIEDISVSRMLYRERLALVEQRAMVKDENYDRAQNLLKDHPHQSHFIKYNWIFYRDISSIDFWENKRPFIMYAPRISRQDLEEYITDFDTEQEKLKNLERLLRDNPNRQTFYELDGRYYTSNPTRVPWNNISAILRVKQVSRSHLEAKVESIEKWSIESISLQLDRAIANTNNPSIRNYLMDLRIWISLNGNNDFILTFWERIWSLINLLEKSQIEPLSLSEIWEILLLSFNILRSGVSDWVRVVISLIKDVSSNRLYKFWEENSEYEQIIRDSFETGNIWQAISFLGNIFPDYFVEWIREWWIDTASLPLAVWAGGIDGFLDYIQASVDIVVIPDTIIQNIWQLSVEIYRNWGSMLNELARNFTKVSDYMYVLSYIVAVVLSFKVLPSKIGILALPNVIMRWLQASGKIPANMLEWVGNFLTNNMQRIEVLVNNNIKWASISGEKIWTWINTALRWGQKVRDSLDGSNTLINSIWVNARQVRASREALSLTNNSLKLAQIFWESIVWRTNEALTTRNAMSAYREMILKWNWFDIDDIDALITQTKWEVRYNLVLIRERLMEVEEIIDSEVLPVWNENQNLLNNYDPLSYDIFIENINTNINSYNQLSKVIFRQLILNDF